MSCSHLQGSGEGRIGLGGIEQIIPIPNPLDVYSLKVVTLVTNFKQNKKEG